MLSFLKGSFSLALLADLSNDKSPVFSKLTILVDTTQSSERAPPPEVVSNGGAQGLKLAENFNLITIVKIIS